MYCTMMLQQLNCCNWYQIPSVWLDSSHSLIVITGHLKQTWFGNFVYINLFYIRGFFSYLLSFMQAGRQIEYWSGYIYYVTMLLLIAILVMGNQINDCVLLEYGRLYGHLTSLFPRYIFWHCCSWVSSIYFKSA